MKCTKMLNQFLKHWSHFFVLVSPVWTNNDQYLICTLQQHWVGLDKEEDLSSPILVGSKQTKEKILFYVGTKRAIEVQY